MAPRRLPTLCHKTQMCQFFLNRQCAKGPSCNFAHSALEVKPMPELHRTKLCPAVIEKGECSDPDCMFAHTRNELRSYPQKPPRQGSGANKKGGHAQHVLALSNAIENSDQQHLPGISNGLAEVNVVHEAALASSEVSEESQGSAKRNKFHKTKMCSALVKVGKCLKGARCDFAHTEEELKPLPNLSNTKMCLNMLFAGTCGDKDCMFAHSERELRSLPPGQACALFERLKSDSTRMDSRSTSMTTANGTADKASTSPYELEELCASLMSSLRVVNTFIHFDKTADEDMIVYPPRRASSTPPRFAGTTEEPKPAATPEQHGHQVAGGHEVFYEEHEYGEDDEEAGGGDVAEAAGQVV